MEMCKIMIGEKEAKKLETISLSNNTIKSRIEALSENFSEQIIDKVKKSKIFANYPIWIAIHHN